MRVMQHLLRIYHLLSGSLRSRALYVRLIPLVIFSSFIVLGIFRSSYTHIYEKVNLAEQVRLHNDVKMRRALVEQAGLLQEIPHDGTELKCGGEQWPSHSLESRRLQALHSAIFYLTNITKSLVPDIFKTKDLSNGKLICAMYEIEGLYERAKVERVWGKTSNHDTNSVTLVTQLSVEKLNMLSLLADSWPGSVSASLHVNITQLQQLCRFFTIHRHLLTKPNLDIHIVLKRGVLYPVNLLRQLALDAAATRYVFLVDADFIPDPGLYKTIQTYIHHGYIGEKQALVVPCFQFNWSPGSAFPQTKQELLSYWDVDMVQPFVSCGFLPGEKPTNYTKWRKSSQPYQVEKFLDGYEPYIVSRKSGLPNYNMKFLGRIRDKISHLFHIYALGYTFTVIPSNFIIHIPHSQQCKVLYARCAFDYYKIFYEDLKRRYPQRVGRPDVLPDDRSIRPVRPTNETIIS